MKYIKKFENHTQYNAYTGSTEMIKPCLALCETEWETHVVAKGIGPSPGEMVVINFNAGSPSSNMFVINSGNLRNITTIAIDGVNVSKVLKLESATDCDLILDKTYTVKFWTNEQAKIQLNIDGIDYASSSNSQPITIQLSSGSHKIKKASAAYPIGLIELI